MPARRNNTGIRNERGSAMLEAIFSLLLLLIIFFGFLQIFKMSAVKMFCDYSSYCATRARALGYRHYIVERAGRVPLMPVSGDPIIEGSSSAYLTSGYTSSAMDNVGSSNYNDIYQQATAYMQYGPMVIDYSYWQDDNENNSTSTEQFVDWNFRGNSTDVGYAAPLITAQSGFISYPSGFEFLDQSSGRRMTFSTVKEDKFVTNDNDFTYDTTQKEVTMQNYSRYIITESYWAGK